MERNSRKLIKLLEKDGWLHVRSRGSYISFKHADFDHVITVPHPNKDMPTGTVRDIYNKASWRK